MSRILILLLLIPMLSVAQNRKKKDYLVAVTTPYGTIRLVLYDQTPKHKENFIKLVTQKTYDSLLFHRIIPLFMIQGGDPNSRQAKDGDMLGNGDLGYTIPAEFVPTLFHKKGALAAARDNNPEKASSASQFYIVQGHAWDNEGMQKQLERIRAAKGRLPTDTQIQVYKSLGGVPHLDGNYTVFGEVLDGLSIVDSIINQPRDEMDRPLKNIRMTMIGDWVKKKTIRKKYGYTFL